MKGDFFTSVFFVDQLKEKQEKTHEAQQRARSQKQLEMAKQANIEKLVSQYNYSSTALMVTNISLMLAFYI